MILGYALKLGLKICTINVRIQKINGSIFKIFKTVLANFEIENKFEKPRFF